MVISRSLAKLYPKIGPRKMSAMACLRIVATLPFLFFEPKPVSGGSGSMLPAV